MKLYNPFKRINELLEDNRGLANALMEMAESSKKRISPETVVNEILGRGIDWYDYKDLGFAEQISYWNDTQSLIKNNVLMNEYGHFLATMIKEMAKDMNVEQLKYARFGIVTMEAFLEHLKQINNPDKMETTKEIYESI